MNRLAALLVASMLTVGMSGQAFADTSAQNSSHTKIMLTVHQERALMDAVTQGADRMVLPLTDAQQHKLESLWPGWSSSVLTVYVADLMDNDGSIYVAP